VLEVRFPREADTLSDSPLLEKAKYIILMVIASKSPRFIKQL
jgi:hypothetical protein